MAEDTDQSNTLELATELTIAWLSNPNTNAAADDVPAFLQKVHGALNGVGSPPAPEEPAQPEYTPAVSVRKSLSNKDHIISMIDGKPYKTLRRHLSGHGLTPDDYRARYGLKPDYPMVSESYSQVRRDMAKKIGLGRKPGDTAAKRSASGAAKPAPASDKAAPAKTVAPRTASAPEKAVAAQKPAPTAGDIATAAPAMRGRKPKAQAASA